MVKGFSTKSLLFCIFIVLLMLGCCVTLDYATNTSIVYNESTLTIPKNTIVVNECTKFNEDPIIPSSKDKVHTLVARKVKQTPTISMWAKPSVRCGYAYRWYYRTFIDYCPNCHRYNALLKNPKGVPENEYTCKFCDSDYDGVVGKEKYSWSRVYLRRA